MSVVRFPVGTLLESEVELSPPSACLEPNCTGPLVEDNTGSFICSSCGVVASHGLTLLPPRCMDQNTDKSLCHTNHFELKLCVQNEQDKIASRKRRLLSNARARYNRTIVPLLSAPGLDLERLSIDYFRRLGKEKQWTRCNRPDITLAACVLTASRAVSRMLNVDDVCGAMFPDSDLPDTRRRVKRRIMRLQYLLKLNKPDQVRLLESSLRSFSSEMDLRTYETRRVDCILHRMTRTETICNRRASTIAAAILLIALGGRNVRADGSRVTASSLHKMTKITAHSITECARLIQSSL